MRTKLNTIRNSYVISDINKIWLTPKFNIRENFAIFSNAPAGFFKFLQLGFNTFSSIYIYINELNFLNIVKLLIPLHKHSKSFFKACFRLESKIFFQICYICKSLVYITRLHWKQLTFSFVF